MIVDHVGFAVIRQGFEEFRERSSATRAGLAQTHCRAAASCATSPLAASERSLRS